MKGYTQLGNIVDGGKNKGGSYLCGWTLKLQQHHRTGTLHDVEVEQKWLVPVITYKQHGLRMEMLKHANFKKQYLLYGFLLSLPKILFCKDVFQIMFHFCVFHLVSILLLS